MRRYVFLAVLSLALSVAPAAWAGPEDEIRALFERVVAAQNAHDLSAVGDLLWDSARFLWVTRGTPIWGREAGLKRFEALYHGTWHLEPNAAELQVTMLSSDVPRFRRSRTKSLPSCLSLSRYLRWPCSLRLRSCRSRCSLTLARLSR